MRFSQTGPWRNFVRRNFIAARGCRISKSKRSEQRYSAAAGLPLQCYSVKDVAGDEKKGNCVALCNHPVLILSTAGQHFRFWMAEYGEIEQSFSWPHGKLSNDPFRQFVERFLALLFFSSLMLAAWWKYLNTQGCTRKVIQAAFAGVWEVLSMVKIDLELIFFDNLWAISNANNFYFAWACYTCAWL